ncbi:MAG: hypothetical protein GY930_08485, partial [bacterium]|nr:hypothetical protein [bacterium]
SAYRRDFLGFGLWSAPGKKVLLRVAAKALERMKDRVRDITSPTRGRRLHAVAADLRRYLLGWRGHFGTVYSQSKTNGFADDSERSTSSNGNVAERPSVSYAREEPRSA